MSRRLVVTLGPALALAAASCATLQQLASGAFEKPSVAYKSMSLTDVSLSGATVNVVTTVTNPNGVGLSLTDVDYRLSVDGHAVATGKPPGGLEIPAHGTADVTLPATVRFSDLGAALNTVLGKDKARYRADGTLGLNTPIGVVRLPFSHEESFDLPKVPAIALGTPRLTRIGLDRATVELPLTLTNRGSYPLPLDALTAGVRIGGAQVGEVSSRALGVLQPGASQAVTLPLVVPLGGALDAASAILRGGPVPISLEGNLQSGPVPVPFSLSTTAQFRR
jgi:LEA14-like dessication related protein